MLAFYFLTMNYLSNIYIYPYYEIIFIQVLQDGRLVDLPLSEPFLRLMCGEELTIEHLAEIDPIRHRYSIIFLN